jgi:hypothetical protein
MGNLIQSFTAVIHLLYRPKKYPQISMTGLERVFEMLLHSSCSYSKPTFLAKNSWKLQNIQIYTYVSNLESSDLNFCWGVF